ncbi:hypothetical protein FRB90_002804 [Tulasnella sp. 427]|nr:hypothetical protein FRB90_002804 [Tulasnella sp. 427]
MHKFNDDKAAPPYSEAAAPGYTAGGPDNRPIPEGWIRQWDPNNQEYFFVDTRANPPRSIWDHPLDDAQYRKSRGLPVNRDSDSESTSSSSSSSSDSSDSENKKKKKSEKSGKKLKRGPSHNGQPAASNAGGGLLGILAQSLFGPRPIAHPAPAPPGPSNAQMQPPPAMPMQPSPGPMMYAPPSYPVTRREMKMARRAEKRAHREERRANKRARRAEKRARKHERRMFKAQEKAIRKGYAIPTSPGVPGVPSPSHMPQMPSPQDPGMSREYPASPAYGMPAAKSGF